VIEVQLEDTNMGAAVGFGGCCNGSVVLALIDDDSSPHPPSDFARTRNW